MAAAIAAAVAAEAGAAATEVDPEAARARETLMKSHSANCSALRYRHVDSTVRSHSLTTQEDKNNIACLMLGYADVRR